MFDKIKEELIQSIQSQFKLDIKQRMIGDKLDLTALPSTTINFNKLIEEYLFQWSISKEDYQIFGKLGLQNKTVLELGRFFGTSTKSFLNNGVNKVISIDDSSFVNMELEYFEQYINQKTFTMLKNMGVKFLLLNGQLITNTCHTFLKDCNVQYVNSTFKPSHLNQFGYDVIFEDIVYDEKTLPILQQCIDYFNDNNIMLIVHDDVRFPIVHNYIKDLKYCYTSDKLFEIYGIKPNLAVFSKQPLKKDYN
jgi:hypothetical protein